VDCLQTFRNGFYHKHLDRKLALAKLSIWGDRLATAHDIPPKQPSQAPAEGTHPVNEAERRLRHLLLAAGFEEGVRGEQLRLGAAIGTTTPDVIYRTIDHAADEGICLYLDGLSAHLHGHRETAERDRRIRDWLRNNGYEVIEIAANDLFDKDAMTRHFRKLAGYLSKPELKERLRSDASWYRTPVAEAAATERPLVTLPTERAVLRIVQPTAAERYVTCLPLVPLKAAAGAFGDPQHIPEDSEWTQWVAVDAVRHLHKGMFVAQVVGKSMEPRIPDGAYCVFRAPVEGTRQGKIVLAQLRSGVDPESGERYTVKQYESEKSTGPDGTWRHVTVTLRPLNRDFQPILLTVEDEGAVAVVAEFVIRL
jgi:phage repressor protein C with HTH and peptisase S24 domain